MQPAILRHHRLRRQRLSFSEDEVVLAVGVGIGTVFGALILGISRNPSLKDELFKMAILGFALTEAIALFALMIVFLFLFAL